MSGQSPEWHFGDGHPRQTTTFSPYDAENSADSGLTNLQKDILIMPAMGYFESIKLT
jgi:hypothetical protein